MSRGIPGAGTRLRGHALTESLVCLPVLMLVLSAIPVVGQYVEMRQTALDESRQHIWQATVDANPANRPRGSATEWLAAEVLTTSALETPVPAGDWLGYWLRPCAGERPETACIVEAAAILADDWSAASDNDGASQVRQWVPARRMEPVGAAVSSLSVFPWFDELAPLKNSFGHVDMQAMPAWEPLSASERKHR